MNHLARQILDFWFGGASENGYDVRWFQSTPAFDQRIAEGFGNTLVRAGEGAFSDWGFEAHCWLAYIVLTDQFPRNIFRGLARAFAFDGLALDMAKRGVAHGLDRKLSPIERSFAYMPFEHSEHLHDQHTCVALFRELLQSAPMEARERMQSSLDFAEQHREIIARFGRFPHRNAVLGRTPTRDELRFLETANRFGQ